MRTAPWLLLVSHRPHWMDLGLVSLAAGVDARPVTGYGTIAAMNQLWTEFKAFAMGGNMFDLALGFILGTAFATIVESLAGNVLMQLVAAIFGQPDFSQLVFTLNGAEIKYGAFLTDLVQFVLLALVLFLIVKLLKKAGLGNFRAQGQMECPYCKEFVAIDALKCKHCTADIDPGQLDEEDVEILEARRRTDAGDHHEPPSPRDARPDSAPGL